MTHTGLTVGIDFGTSTSLTAEASPGIRPDVVPMGDSTRWMPSVAAMRDGTLVAGEDALRRAPHEVIRSAKRAITRNKTSISVETPGGPVSVPADAAMRAILTELAMRARLENLPVGDPGVVRMGCPAMWNGDQRERLLRLAREAGIGVGVQTLVDEPIAAGLSFINHRVRMGEALDAERVLVFDMGGGTLDVAVLDVTANPGQDPAIFVLAANGLDEAGDALDDAIAADLEAKLLAKGIDVSDLPDPLLARAYVRRAATEAKIALTDLPDASVTIDYRGADLPTLHYAREELDNALRPQMDRAAGLVWSTLRAAEVAYTRRDGTRVSAAELRRRTEAQLAAKVAHLVLVGGMSRVPGVATYLGRHFPAAKLHDHVGVPVEEAVVAGLAETTSYERVNLHRPGFDFVVEWGDSGGDVRRETVYRAHTPFYEAWETTRRDHPRYEWPTGRTAVNSEARRSMPRAGTGLLRVVANDGSNIALQLRDGHEEPGIPFRFGHAAPRLVLSQDGGIVLFDGQGTDHRFRVDRWPVLRTSGRERSTLRLTQQTPWVPMDRPAWDVK